MRLVRFPTRGGPTNIIIGSPAGSDFYGFVTQDDGKDDSVDHGEN